MRVPSESYLRDLLAADLTLVEPGLELVATEYPLRNAVGTRGFVDLLARDPHGSWVVVELKRSKKTTREAVHEVAKYVELLCREEGLPRDRARAIIIAVEWGELLVPASSIARDWLHDMTCYRLVLDVSGRPVGVERVDLLPPPLERGVSPIHFIYFFNSPQERERGWRQASSCAGDHGLVGVHLRYTRADGLAMAPYALYVAIGRVMPENVVPSLVTEADALDKGDVLEAEYPLERALLRRICRDVHAAYTESANPDTYRHLMDHDHWEVEQVRRSGALEKDRLREDEDLGRAMAGNDGHSQFQFTGSATPRSRNRWRSFRAQMETSLAGNDQWRQLIRLWLDDIAEQRPDDDVVLHIFNPCDLMQTLVFGWPDRLADYAPSVLGISSSKDHGTVHTANGTLYWDGHHVPNLGQLVRMVYREPLRWLSARHGGVTWQRDQELLELLGLRYLLVDTVMPAQPLDGDQSQQATFLAVCSDGPQWITDPMSAMAREDWNGLYTVDTFLEEHADQVVPLVTQYRSLLGISPNG